MNFLFLMLAFMPWGELAKIWQHNSREYNYKAVVINCFLPLIFFIDVLFFFTDFLCNALMKEADEETSQTKKITAFMSLSLFRQNFVLFVKVTRLLFLSSFPACFACYIWRTSIKCCCRINCAEIDVKQMEEIHIFISESHPSWHLLTRSHVISFFVRDIIFCLLCSNWHS